MVESAFKTEKDNNTRVYPAAKVGLLSPYGGTNLGDGAIQEAAIEGMRRYLPKLELWGITLNPIEIQRRHGILGFPITGLRVPFYSDPLFGPIKGFSVRFLTESISADKIENKGFDRSYSPDSWRMRQSLKKVPLLGYTLRRLADVMRKIFTIIHEIRQLKAAFHFVSNLDMVMVSGSGQLDETWGGAWGHPYVLFRWAILARLARKHFIVVSVGVDEVKTILCKFFIRTALSLASYRSYRDVVSKKLLSKWAFTKNDACVPDLAFGLFLPMENSPSISNKRPPVVGISPMAFGRDGSWPRSMPEVYNRYLSCLKDLVALLIRRECKVVLFKSSGIDRYAIEDLLAIMEPAGPAGSLDRVSAPIVDTTEDLLQEVRKVDFVVASRLHGVILSHILGKSVLAIAYERKVRTHMKDMDQGEYVLDLDRLSTNDLIDCFESLLGEAEESKRKIKKHVIDSREAVEKQFQHISRLTKIVSNAERTLESIYETGNQ